MTRVDRSLFLRLLPRLGPSSSRRRADGQEEYLTQVVAAVLEQDPALVLHLARTWLDRPFSAPFDVAAEVPFSAPSGVEQDGVRVDLVLRSPEALIFIENKIGSALNRYATETQEEIDQVALYHRVLEAQRGAREGHLLVLCRDPQSRHEGLTLYQGHRFWWDLHELIKEWLERGRAGSAHAAWLQRELLKFFAEVHLDPPKPLRPGVAFNTDHALRLLASAARKVPSLGNPRMASGLLFHRGGSDWSVSFQGDRLTVFESGKGARVPPEPGPEFWQGKAEPQVDWLADLLVRVDTLPRADTATTPLDAALEQFDVAHRDLAALIVEDLRERWRCEPLTGQMRRARAEITFRGPDGLAARLGPYRENTLILVPRADVSSLRQSIERVLGHGLSTPTREWVVGVPLRDLSPETYPVVMETFLRHGEPS